MREHLAFLSHVNLKVGFMRTPCPCSTSPHRGVSRASFVRRANRPWRTNFSLYLEEISCENLRSRVGISWPSQASLRYLLRPALPADSILRHVQEVAGVTRLRSGWSSCSEPRFVRSSPGQLGVAKVALSALEGSSLQALPLHCRSSRCVTGDTSRIDANILATFPIYC